MHSMVFKRLRVLLTVLLFVDESETEFKAELSKVKIFLKGQTVPYR